MKVVFRGRGVAEFVDSWPKTLVPSASNRSTSVWTLVDSVDSGQGRTDEKRLRSSLSTHVLPPGNMPAMAHDPIAFELFKNAIFSIADEMALTVFRTTYSGVLKDNMDYSTGFADGDG